MCILWRYVDTEPTSSMGKFINKSARNDTISAHSINLLTHVMRAFSVQIRLYLLFDHPVKGYE